MIKVTKSERIALEDAGLLVSRRTGRNRCDANYTVVNREHIGRDKTTYVTEEDDIMLFLGRYENLNLQRINPHQLKQLREKQLITENNSQKWGTYVPDAIAFEDNAGNWRIKKVAAIMLELGIWSNNKTKRNNPYFNKTHEVFTGTSVSEVED